MPSNRQFLGMAVLAAAALTSGTAFAASPTGVWINDTGRGAVEIKECADGLCGHVVWVKDTADTKGCGRQIIGKAQEVGDGLWDNGWIYSPERKKKYDVELKPLADGTLRVKGYAGTKLFSKTMIWTPAPADLVRCGTEQTTSTSAGAQVATAAPASPAPAATPAPAAPAPEAKSETPPAAETPAQDDAAAADESEEGSEGSELADALGEFLKKDGKGNCKIDLPWVKVDFQCEGEEEPAPAAKTGKEAANK